MNDMPIDISYIDRRGQQNEVGPCFMHCSFKTPTQNSRSAHAKHRLTRTFRPKKITRRIEHSNSLRNRQEETKKLTMEFLFISNASCLKKICFCLSNESARNPGRDRWSIDSTCAASTLYFQALAHRKHQRCRSDAGRFAHKYAKWKRAIGPPLNERSVLFRLQNCLKQLQYCEFLSWNEYRARDSYKCSLMRSMQ